MLREIGTMLLLAGFASLILVGLGALVYTAVVYAVKNPYLLLGFVPFALMMAGAALYVAGEER